MDGLDPEIVKQLLPESGSNQHLHILYITLAIIVFILIVWLFLVWLTGEDQILSIIQDSSLQVSLANEDFVLPDSEVELDEPVQTL
jgi:hypothetical protein